MENYIGQGNVAPPDGQAYPQQMPPQKKRNTSLIIGIIVGVVALAAIIVVLVLFVFTPGGGGGSAEVRDPAPLFYMEDDDIFIASGTETLQLDDADVIDEGYGPYINGMMSYDCRYVYYLAEVDADSGAGKLMAMDVKGDMEPTLVAEGVCAAKISSNGKRYLYVADVEDEIGTLYYGELGGEADKISGDVIVGEYDMSPDGSHYYFTKRTSDDEDMAFAIYAASKGKEPVKMEDGEQGKGDNVYRVIVLDDGSILYSYETMDEETYEYDTTLYLYADGDRDKIASDASLEMMFESSGDILYSEERTLYYLSGGEEKERISKDFNSLLFPPYFGGDAAHEYDKHFLLVEDDADDEDSYSDEVTLYEMEIGKDPVKITKADAWGYQINGDFSWISFTRDGETYLCYKEKDGWSERIKVCDNALDSGFDMAGKYFYYIEAYDESDSYGDLYRFELSSRTEEAELMQYDVNFYELMDDVAYTRTTDDEIYRVNSRDDKTLLFDEKVVFANMAPNGMYLAMEAKDYDIYYVPANGDESVTLCFDAQEIVYLNGVITHHFTPPLPDEVAGMLSEAYDDAVYFMDLINETSNSTMADSHRYYDETLDILEGYLDMEDVGEEAMALISDFYWGYYYIGEYAYATLGSVESQDATDSLNEYFAQAFEKYDKLVGDHVGAVQVEDTAPVEEE
jgi:hypothetical protein